MATKDIGRGWGELNGTLTSWHCPDCNSDSPVSDWSEVRGIVNGHDLDGRKCPKCEFSAFQHHETERMIPK